MLEKSLNLEEIPKPTCKTDQIEKNQELAKKLRIGSTPTLVFADGRVYPGAKTADRIIALLDGDPVVNSAPTRIAKPKVAK
jgi:thiol:disulfide interchange protein DsbC